MTAPQMIFVNLPVTDLAASRAFWTSLGYPINETFSDENALSVVLGDAIAVMLLKTEYFQTFTSLPVADAKASTQTLLALSSESREAVDSLVEAAVAAGATEPREPQDLGFMFQRTFSDLDGHTWEITWMDPSGFGGDAADGSAQ